MINVIECKDGRYPARTAINARDSDGTIAFAHYFETTGEKLTESLCKQYNKPILKIPLLRPLRDIDEVASHIISWLKVNNIKHVNIAGNGIRTLDGLFSQEELDTYLYLIFKKVLESYSLEHGRSGGQTGADEAGVKALDQLGVPTTIVYPKGYRIRTLGKDKDTYNKEIACSRFDQVINPEFPLETAKYF